MSEPFQVQIGAATDVGRVREGNEDAYLVMPGLALAVVADGMGGHQSGNVASAVAVRTIQSAFEAQAPPSTESSRPGFFSGLFRRRGGGADTAEGRLADVVRRANEKVLTLSKERREYKGMGTTVDGLWIVGDAACWVHVGDGRIYHLRGPVLRQITEDHSLVNEYLRLGVLREEQVARFPYKNIIVRAVGLSPGVEVDTGRVPLQSGDRFLLCSDGLTDLVENERIRSLLAAGHSPQASAEALVELALEAGGTDNVTAVVVEATENGAP